MPIRSTHTFATLGVSSQTFDEIASLLRIAGYDHAFAEDGLIDLHGLGLMRVAGAPAPQDIKAAADGIAAAPELAGSVPLVLYFPTDAARDEFIQIFQEAKPGLKITQL